MPEFDRHVRALLINPNTSRATTDLMVGIARRAAGSGVEIDGATAPFGQPLITDEAALGTAGGAVWEIFDGLAPPLPDGLIVSAFGDPGVDALRQRAPMPVVGLAEASMIEAAADGRQFSVVTTTPDLVAAIDRCAARYGVADHYLGTRTTSGDARQLMADSRALQVALERIIHEAIAQDRPGAIIIGGGPLAEAARTLADMIDVAIIEPIPAAVRLMQRRWQLQSPSPA